MTLAFSGSDTVAVIRAQLTAWLAIPDASLQPLVNWLQGFDLSGIGHDYEPAVWLLRAVELESEPETLAVPLAKRLAQLIDSEPEAQLADAIDRPVSPERIDTWVMTAGQTAARPGESLDVIWPAQVLHNALILAAGFRHRYASWPWHADTIFESLRRMLRRRRLRGFWNGAELTSALRSALASNQIDHQFVGLWNLMLTGFPHEYLGGDVFAGFRGIALAPESNERRDRPWLPGIGRALKHVGVRLLEMPDGIRDLQYLIRELCSEWPKHLTWDYDLVMLAHEHDWPSLMIEAIPTSLCFRSGPESTSDGQPEVWFVWREYSSALVEAGQATQEWCGGVVVKVTLDLVARGLARTIGMRIDPARSRCIGGPRERGFVVRLREQVRELERFRRARQGADGIRPGQSVDRQTRQAFIIATRQYAAGGNR